MNRYDFQERLEWSQGVADEPDVAIVLRNRLPLCDGIVRSSLPADKNGTDFWATRRGLTPLSIDLKVREHDFGKNDLALETWSDIDRSIPGWTRNPNKRTDYVVWFWRDSRRFVLLPFPPLCFIFRRSWLEFSRSFPTATQDSGSWRSQCVYVPIPIVFDHLLRWCRTQLP